MASQLSKSSRATTDRLERAFGHPRTSESFPTNIIIYYIELSRGFVIFDFYPDFLCIFCVRQTNSVTFGDLEGFLEVWLGLGCMTCICGTFLEPTEELETTKPENSKQLG